MTASPFASAPAATIGRRVGAYLIDGVIASVILIVAMLAVTAIAVVPASTNEALLAGVLAVYAVAFVGAIGWGIVYTVMQGGRGSFGQRILGIRLADAATGAPIGFGRALVRNLVWIVSLWIIVGYFTPLFDSSGRLQGWHDKAARAVVVSSKGKDAASPRGIEGAVPSAFAAAPVIPAPAAFLPAPAAAPFAAAPLPQVPFPAAPFPPAPAAAEPLVSAPSAFAESGAPSGLGEAPPYAAPVSAPVSAPALAPAPAAPVAAGSASALISSVPGVTGDRPRPAAPPPVSPPAVIPAAAAVAATLAHEPVAETVLTSTTQTAPGEDLDETRIAPPRARAVVALTWDDGTRTAVYGRTLFGRNPAREEGATVVAVRDETLSLSKTHFEIGGDGAGAWIADRHSTNGTVLVRDGRRETIEPGTQVALLLGDRLEFGDRSVRVGDDS